MDAEIFGSDGEAADLAIVDFGDEGFAAEGNFVEAVGSVDDEGALRAEFGESGGHYIDYVGGIDADDLGVRSGGIGERAEEIESGAHADLFARGGGVASGGVSGGSEQKSEAQFANGVAAALERNVDADAEGFEHVGGAAARTGGAIAVLGDVRAGCRGDDGGRGGNIESVAAIAAGAAGVDQMRGTEAFIGENGGGVAAHDAREAGQLLRVDGAGVHSEKQADDFGGFGAAGENLFHGRFGFRAR